MAELDPTGLSISTQAEIQAGIEADERAEISTRLDLSTSSPLGQLNRLISRAIRIQEEGLAAVYNGIDPDSAAGDALFRLGALTGTIREPASYSRAVLTLDLDAGTYAAGDLAFYPDGRPAELFESIEEVTSVGTPLQVTFQATVVGPLDTFATAILVPFAGWNSIDSIVSFESGSREETEAAFRARRNAEVESPGSSSASGIAADLTREIAAIESCFVTENDTDATVDSVPPHSIEVVVFGPLAPTDEDNDAVAEQILASKAAGIGTYGNVTRVVYDSEDQPHSIRFTRPSNVAISPVLAVSVAANGYAGDDALIAHIVERAAETYVPGLNAAWSQYVAWAMEVAGVLRVSSVDLGGGPFVDVAITSRQIATVDAGDVSITSTTATP